MKLIPALLLLAVIGQAEPARPPAGPTLSEAALLRHIRVLADDRMEGRKPGTRGGALAVDYIRREFDKIGLPVILQPVDLIERRPDRATASWTGQNGLVPIPEDQAIFTGRDRRTTLKAARLIFAGYGLDAASGGHHDLDLVDLRGAMVLLLSGRPADAPTAPGLEVRRAAILARGAAGVIALPGENDPWPLIREGLKQGRTTLASARVGAVEGAFSFDTWKALLSAGGIEPVDAVAAAQRADFRAMSLSTQIDLQVTTHVRRIRSVNVIGRLVGRDRPDEALLYMAHWDHLGLCRPKGAVDRICNGAVDNASGVAELIEIARALAKGPRSGRSILFVATTGEEMGLLGARAFVQSPPLPLDHIVAALNLDTVVIAPRGKAVAIIGRGRTRLDPIIDRTVQALGREVDASDAANAFLNRQDGAVLLNAGIPSVMIGGAYSDAVLLADFLGGHYHHPDDDLAHLPDLGGAAEDGALHVELGRILSDPAQFPTGASR